MLTICNSELQLNIVNNADELNSIWKCITRLSPSKLKVKQERLVSDNSNPADKTELPDLLQPPEPSLLTAGNKIENEIPRNQAQEREMQDDEQKGHGRLLELQMTADRVLSDAGIVCCNTSFTYFTPVK